MSAMAENINGKVTVGGYPTVVHNGKVLLPKGTGLTTPRRSRAARPAQGSVDIKKFTNPEANYGPQAVARRIVETLGNNVAAALLGVNQDRPGRWVRGEDTPSEENRAKLADLDSLVGQMLAVFTPEQAILWLKGQNPFLHARPIDVYALEGPERLISALKSYEQGAYA